MQVWCPKFHKLLEENPTLHSIFIIVCSYALIITAQLEEVWSMSGKNQPPMQEHFGVKHPVQSLVNKVIHTSYTVHSRCTTTCSSYPVKHHNHSYIITSYIQSTVGVQPSYLTALILFCTTITEKGTSFYFYLQVLSARGWFPKGRRGKKI